ncbi:hypothetical protein KIS4809_2978 [Bacillus sp. ZZV12-4809]|uniref:hypothetical protein n=1 Tax=Cytobacillus sp. AMY 15.2 TaxID=2939563 RepID=UPI0013F8163A|nr:hypothetical protein [Cytobacillus sp. AMY 15.2]KAF0818176.1 hypothetical protein KIS4809_2978 [Bacillus sp. ZZV12-4809]
MEIFSICLVVAAPESGSPPFRDWSLAAVKLFLAKLKRIPDPQQERHAFQM